MTRAALLQLAERLERMVAEPGWLTFHLRKDEAEVCAAALKARAAQGGVE